MRRALSIAAGLVFMLTGHAMAEERISIASEWGSVTATLAENDATRALVKMLPIYYRSGRVPPPGIVILGEVVGDISVFDRPGAVTVRVERVK